MLCILFCSLYLYKVLRVTDAVVFWCIVGYHKKCITTPFLSSVRSGTDCFFLLQDDILLEVEDVYHLLVEFPKPVNEDTAAAVFNKKKRRLLLKVNLLD